MVVSERNKSIDISAEDKIIYTFRDVFESQKKFKNAVKYKNFQDAAIFFNELKKSYKSFMENRAKIKKRRTHFAA